MKHRIAAGVIVEDEGRILLVRHSKPGVYDFWVTPGGGAEGTEDLLATAKREVFEECGLLVEHRKTKRLCNCSTQRGLATCRKP